MKEVRGVVSRGNPSSPFWTYRMEDVADKGKSPGQPAPNYNDPATLLHLLLNFTRTQILDVRRQSLRRAAAATQTLARMKPRRSRFAATTATHGHSPPRLERWQGEQPRGPSSNTVAKIRSATWSRSTRPALMGDLANFVSENHENLIDGEYALADFRRSVRSPPGPPQHDAGGPAPGRLDQAAGELIGLAGRLRFQGTAAPPDSGAQEPKAFSSVRDRRIR